MFISRTNRLTIAVGLTAATALLLSGCGTSNPLEDGGSDSAEPSGGGDAIVIGSQAYYSNEIIAEIYAQALEADGQKVDRQFNIGQRDAYMPDIESGAIDLFPEYTGNLLEFLDDTAEATSPDDVYAALQKALPEGLTALDYAEASDQDTYTVTEAFAEQHALKTIEDLASVGSPVTLGGAPELEQRPYGPKGAKEIYGLDLAFSATGDTSVEALIADKVQVADVYSADPRFQTEKIVALEDPKNMILASNVVPIASSDVADTVAPVINKVSKALTVDELVSLNVQSTKDKKSAPDIAKEWLAEKKLG